MSITQSMKKDVHVRLREREVRLLKEIVDRYGISEADVMRLALINYAKMLGIDKDNP